MKYWTVRSELQRKKGSDSKLTYVEVQAMLDDYDEEAEVSDYMAVVLNFGFLTMLLGLTKSDLAVVLSSQAAEVWCRGAVHLHAVLHHEPAHEAALGL